MFRAAICKLLVASAICCSWVSAATYTVYLHAGTNTPELRKLVTKVLPQDAPEARPECRFVEVKTSCTNLEEAEAIAAAMEAGVTHMPCLVLSDAQGAYATLLLRGLKSQAITEAAATATAADREQKAEPLRYNARLYRLFARCKYASATAEQLSPLVDECRALLAHPLCTKEQQQLIGLRCLYPLLMKQYTLGYKGAHTPATEAKLLEAIAALEAARDLDPESAMGQKAHDERHRLRMARREARKYE